MSISLGNRAVKRPLSNSALGAYTYPAASAARPHAPITQGNRPSVT